MSPLASPPVLCGLAPLEPVAPAAAAAATPASSGHPAPPACLLWMHASKCNPLVPLAWPKTARSATPASSRRSFGRRRLNAGKPTWQRR